MLVLSDQTPIAAGGTRRVYLHPTRPDRLVKVMLDEPKGRGSALHRFLHRFRVAQMQVLRREIRQFQKVAALPAPVARIDGILETDLGPGEVVERIGAGTALLGPTLYDLNRAGRLDDGLLAELNAFLASAYRLNLVIRDMKPRNLVLGETEGQRRFILVDGLGDKNLIPLRSLFPALNRRRLDRDFAHLAHRLGLAWQDRQIVRRPAV